MNMLRVFGVVIVIESERVAPLHLFAAHVYHAAVRVERVKNPRPPLTSDLSTFDRRPLPLTFHRQVVGLIPALADLVTPRAATSERVDHG